MPTNARHMNDTPENAPPVKASPTESKAAEPAAHASAVQDKRVGECLIEERLITQDQLREALAHQAQHGGKTLAILLSKGYLTNESLHTFLSKQSGVPSFDIRQYEIPQELLSLISQAFAQEHGVLPIDRLGKLLTVGMVCPLDTATIAELERVTGLKVKAMLCKYDDMQAAFPRFYPSDNYAAPDYLAAPRKQAPVAPPSMSRETVAARLRQLEMLPALPGTVRHFQEVTAGSKKAIRDLAGVVCADPAVAAKVLSMANCTAYGLPEHVTNVNLAVTLLGVNGVISVAMQIEKAPAVDAASQFDDKNFWMRSMFCAGAAMSIAKASNRSQVGDAYTAGLLHEIGRLALAVAFPREYARVPNGQSIADGLKAEEQVFGLTHADAGELLACPWRLPASIASAIRHHHRLDSMEQEQDLAAVVALAACMTEAFIGKQSAVEVVKQSKALLGRLALASNEAAVIFEKTSATFKGASVGIKN